MKALNRHISLSTPGFNAKIPAWRIIAASRTNVCLYTRYQNQLELQFNNTAPDPLPIETANTIMRSATPHKKHQQAALYFSTKCVLVPKQLFNQQELLTYSNPSFDVLTSEQLVYHTINNQLVQLFTVPKQWHQAVTAQLGECTWAHPAGILIPAYEAEAALHSNACMFMYATDGLASFTLFQNGQLQSQHHTSFEQANDLLFTLLHSNAQHANTQEPMRLFIHGEWAGLGDFETELNKQHWPISQFTLPNAIELPNVPNTAFLPLHQFYTQCAL